jgi:beta-lactamase class A
MQFFRKLLLLFFFLFLTIGTLWAQSTIPDYYKTNKQFSHSLRQIIKKAGLDGIYPSVDGDQPISFAVIDLNGPAPVIGGVHMQHYIYPASVYKMYVGMEVLKQISEGKYSLYQEHVITNPHNIVDRVKEIRDDPRPLLQPGDTVTINYLLHLMITRSDNSAANIMIDVATRPKINKTMDANGWKGSEVTRKFLDRKYEEPGYKKIRGTETSALDAADFMYKINTNKLINPWVSMEMKNLLGGQLDTTKVAAGLPKNVMFYHKTGWWNMFTNDVGIVDDGHIHYIIALFTPLHEEQADPKMKKVSRLVYKLIKKRDASYP